MPSVKDSPSTAEIKYITIEKGAELLNKSPHSVRQLLSRGKLKKHCVKHNVFLVLDDVMSYHARKKHLPCWEENIENIKTKTFVSLSFASAALMVQPSYLLILVRQKVLEGYITVSGDVMVSRDSINAYLRTPDNDPKDSKL